MGKDLPKHTSRRILVVIALLRQEFIETDKYCRSLEITKFVPLSAFCQWLDRQCSLFSLILVPACAWFRNRSFPALYIFGSALCYTSVDTLFANIYNSRLELWAWCCECILNAQNNERHILWNIEYPLWSLLFFIPPLSKTTCSTCAYIKF